MNKLFGQYKGLRREVYILFFGRIVTNLGSMVWPMLTMILNQKMGMRAGDISWLLILAGIILLPAGMIGGKLADRFSKRNIIVICDAVSIIGYITCACIPLSYISIALMIFSSTFQTMENPAYNALLADLTKSKDRERAYSLSYLGSNLGLMLAPVIGGFLFKNYLWLAFLLNGLSIASSTVLI
ncbi:MAG: MFS transporter [Erysipelotrichaceae bacterium]|nr:MFS transporter [Erysipelotrichaceae bacterium]